MNDTSVLYLHYTQTGWVNQCRNISMLSHAALKCMFGRGKPTVWAFPTVLEFCLMLYRLRRRTYRCWNRRTATQDGSKNQNLGTSRPRSFSVSVVSMIKTHRFPGDTPILVYILLLQFPYKVVPVVPHNWLTWFITLITMVYGRYIYTY